MRASRSRWCGHLPRDTPGTQGPTTGSEQLPAIRQNRYHPAELGLINNPANGRKSMNRTLTLLAACALAGLAIPAQAADLVLTRLDCGTPQAPTAVNQRFSDTYAYGDLKL